MKKFFSALLLSLFLANAIFPCGPGFITPIFEYKHAPENPFQNFAAGKLGVLKPSYRRVVLLAAYRYLNGGAFTAEEQKSLTDVWDAEFKNKDFQKDDAGEAVKAWVEKRKDVVGKEEKIPEIYVERSYGGYDFFPNCTKNAFETAAQTLSDRISNYGSDDKDVKAWLEAQDVVFANCAAGKQTPEAANPAMPEWLQKDRAYQIAAAEFYSLDYEEAKKRFAEIAEDFSSPWQETADYLVGRTLIRQASLTKDEAKTNQFYTEAEERLQQISAKSGKFHASAEGLLGLIKYRLHPKERVGELAQNLSYTGSANFRQDLIDYTWLLDKFEKETLEAEEKRKSEEELKKSNTALTTQTNVAANTASNTMPQTNKVVLVATNAMVEASQAVTNANKRITETSDQNYLSIYLYTDDYKQNWTIYLKPGATDDEAIAEAGRVSGITLTEAMKTRLINSKKTAYAGRYTRDRNSEYQGGYYGQEKTSLSILPEFLRSQDLTDWLFTFQIQNAEAYLYSLSKFKQTSAELWLLTALSKADRNSSELNRLLEAAGETRPTSPAYPTIVYHTARILIEQNKLAEARKLIDETIDSPLDLPVSSRNQFLELRLKLSETLADFLKFAQRRPFAFDWDGTVSGSIDEFIAEQKSWYNAEYEKVSKEEYERNVEESFKEERLWQDRSMFDDKTIEIINEHFPLSVLLEAEKSEALPDYLKKRLAIVIWTRAALLEDFVTAARVAPDVIKFAPETEELMNKFLAAKTLTAKRRAALYLIIKNGNMTPYVSSGLGTAAEGFRMYATKWWCEPYEIYLDEEAVTSGRIKPAQKPVFLTKLQSEAAQSELKKLKEISDAPKFLANKALEWAQLAPADKRVPEILYIVYESNGWDKYGCGSNEELSEEIGNLLKKRYPDSEWTREILDMENQNK